MRDQFSKILSKRNWRNKNQYEKFLWNTLFKNQKLNIFQFFWFSVLFNFQMLLAHQHQELTAMGIIMFMHSISFILDY